MDRKPKVVVRLAMCYTESKVTFCGKVVRWKQSKVRLPDSTNSIDRFNRLERIRIGRLEVLEKHAIWYLKEM